MSCPTSTEDSAFLMRHTLLALLAAVLFTAYLPVLQADYVFHDDLYFFSSWAREHSCHGYEQLYAYRHFYGRPIGGYIKCAYGLSFDTIPQAKYVRLFNLGLLFALAVLGWRWLMACGISRNKSWIIIAPLTLLTCLQTPVAQITNAHHLTAAILALLALWLAWHAEAQRYYWGRMAVASVLGAASMLIYQPAAMLYWAGIVPLVLVQYTRLDRTTFLRFLRVAGPGIVIMLTPLAYAALVGIRRMQFATSLTERLVWLWQQEVPMLLSGWYVFPSPLATSLQLALIAIVLMAGFLRSADKPLWLFKCMAVAGLIFASFLPNFASAETAVIHRTLIATKTLIAGLEIAACIAALSSAQRYIPRGACLQKALPALLLMWGVCVVHHNMSYYYATPLHLEYNFLKRSLYAIEGQNGRTPVHLVRARVPYLTEEKLGDEFGAPNTMFPDDPVNITYAILHEMHSPVTAQDVFSGRFLSVGNDRTMHDRPEPLGKGPVDPARPVIDMNAIQGLLLPPE